MGTLKNRRKEKFACSQKWQSIPFLILVILFAHISISLAQSTNLSDWHVPPPLPPGNITKGDATGKNAKSNAIVLTPTDIPAPQLPKGPPVQFLQAASISTSAPLVNAPEQPVDYSVGGTTPVPSPVDPEAPVMPQLQVHDAKSAVTDMPDPVAPELPPIPAEPLPSKTAGMRTRLPLMPALIGQVSVVFPADAAANYFSIPGMPENNRDNLVMPAAVENDKEPVKPKKIKNKATKNKPGRHR